MTFFEIAVLVLLVLGVGAAGTCVDRLTQIRETLIAIRNRLPLPPSD